MYLDCWSSDHWFTLACDHVLSQIKESPCLPSHYLEIVKNMKLKFGHYKLIYEEILYSAIAPTQKILETMKLSDQNCTRHLIHTLIVNCIVVTSQFLRPQYKIYQW